VVRQDVWVPGCFHVLLPVAVAGLATLTGLASYYRPDRGRDAALLGNLLEVSDDLALMLCMLLVGLSGLYGVVLVLPIGESPCSAALLSRSRE
jgi:hypothetical protein